MTFFILAMFIISYLLMNIYIFNRSKTIVSKKSFPRYFIIISNVLFVLFLISIILFVGLPHHNPNSYRFYFQLNLVFVINFVFTSIFFIFFFGVHIFEIALKLLKTEKKTQKLRKISYKIALVLFLINLSLIIYGWCWGKSSFKVTHTLIESNKLPKSFEGFKILHFSDAHLGSFWNKNIVKKGVEIINQQQADIVVFTGDLVNMSAKEAIDYVELFKSIKAKHGKFAVLGNHDMSDYHKIDIRRDSLNVGTEAIVDVLEEMGFEVLRNSRKYVHNQNGDSLRILGTDNWGIPPFKPWGDIAKAMKDSNEDIFTILLTHDPSHWVYEIKGKKDIDLTLSGHTHGMQIGIFTKRIKFSPVSLKYKYWGGLYKEDNQFLYINLGFGFIGFPFRIGMPPEISILELKKEE